MKLITKQDLIDGVCLRWKIQYFANGEWKYGNNKEDIYNNLVSLGDDKTEQDIEKVIGNNSWTRLSCDICNNDVDRVVTTDFSEYSHYMCLNCASKAVGILLGEKE